MGEFYTQTIYPKGDSGITTPRKGSGALADVEKYGGYKSQKTSYFAIVQSKVKKGQTIKTIEAVPVLTAYRQRSNPNAVLDYFKTYLNEPTILIPKLKVRQLVSYNEKRLYLAGAKSGQIDTHPASELFTDNETDDYVNQLSKLVEMSQNNMLPNNCEEYLVKTNRNKDKKLIVNKKTNMELYTKLKEKLSDSDKYAITTLSSFYQSIERGLDIFATLSTIDQCKVLLQILKGLKCNGGRADLSLINESKESGRILFSKNITNVDFKIICKSPAGLTERIKKV